MENKHINNLNSSPLSQDNKSRVESFNPGESFEEILSTLEVDDTKSISLAKTLDIRDVDMPISHQRLNLVNGFVTDALKSQNLL